MIQKKRYGFLLVLGKNNCKHSWLPSIQQDVIAFYLVCANDV